MQQQGPACTYDDFSKAYVRLRTLLDSLQANTIRYCVEDASLDERVDRINGVEADLMNLIGKVGGEGPCSQGYFLCDGVCVPWPCFGQTEAQSATMLLED
jgi:uncharacterized protein YgbK (DUF1537 family)